MNGLLRLGLLTCLLLSSSNWLRAQTHNYEIRFGNHVIGNVKAHCKVNGALKNIAIESKVQMKLLAKFNLDIACEYNNNLLVHARAVRSSGKESDNRSTTTHRDGQHYTVIQNGERSVLDNTEILHSVAELYFTEPRHTSRVFSETQGIFLPLKALGNGVYELNLPEGKKNIYRYRKGALVQVEINHAFGRAYIVRIS